LLLLLQFPVQLTGLCMGVRACLCDSAVGLRLANRPYTHKIPPVLCVSHLHALISSTYLNFRAETVYDGLDLFQQGRRLQNLIDVPGVQQGEQ
jgi:hypothetical protein